MKRKRKWYDCFSVFQFFSALSFSLPLAPLKNLLGGGSINFSSETKKRFKIRNRQRTNKQTTTQKKVYIPSSFIIIVTTNKQTNNARTMNNYDPNSKEDAATYAYYHPEADLTTTTTIPPAQTMHNAMKNVKSGGLPNEATIAEAWDYGETIPGIGAKDFAGCYRCKATGLEHECFETTCCLFPTCVLNVPCGDNCIWTIWQFCIFPVPHQFCTYFSCERKGPFFVSRDKHGRTACQQALLDPKTGRSGCYLPRNCFVNKPETLPADTQATIIFEPCCQCCGGGSGKVVV